MLSGTWPEERLASPTLAREALGVDDEQLINRAEVVSLLFAVNDAVDELRRIRELLEDEDDEEEDA